MTNDNKTTEYEGFKLYDSMKHKGMVLNYFRCLGCHDVLPENEISTHDCKEDTGLKVVENPKEYEGFEVVKRDGVCLADCVGNVYYNCKGCGSTITEESILKNLHKCWKGLEDKLE